MSLEEVTAAHVAAVAKVSTLTAKAAAAKGDRAAKVAKKLAKWQARASKLKKQKRELAKKRKREESGDADAAAVGGEATKRQRAGSSASTGAGAGAGAGAGEGATGAAEEKPRVHVRVRGSRGGISRMFVGNLSFKITADKLVAFLQGNATHVMWLTDKESGRFYGSAFVEMASAEDANSALMLNGQKLMGRPIKLALAPPRPSDKWPPAETEVTAGGGGTAKEEDDGGNPDEVVPPRSEKPSDDCVKLFLGNLSYKVEDDDVRGFFSECGTLEQIRWLTKRETGEFRGQGFVEFANTEAAEKAVKLNGHKLLGRPIIIDWSE